MHSFTHYRNLISLLLLLLVGQCASGPQLQQNTANVRRLAFVHVNVIPMTGGEVLKDQTVVVEGDTITQIGPASAVRLAADTLQIDGRGKYLMPGLTDFHVHLRDESELLSYLAHGVTTVVHMSGGMGNVSDVIALRRKVRTGETLGPTIYTTGRILDGNPPIFPGVSTVVTVPEEARRAVEDQHQAGVDFIKVYNNLASDVLKAVVEAANQRGLAVIGHIPRRDGRSQALQTALAAGQAMIAHGEEFFFTYFYDDTERLLDRNLPPEVDTSKIPEVVRLVHKSGTAVTPNLSFVAMTRRQLDALDSVLSDPEVQFLHPDVITMWRQQNPTRRSDPARFALREHAKYAFLKELTRALQSGGVLLLLGTDSSAPGMFPGESAHLELEQLVEAGLTPYQALTTGTVNAGKFIDQHVSGAKAFGSVGVGQRADLLLLDANPLTDIANIRQIAGITVRGRWLSKPEIEKMRVDAVKAFRR